MCVISDFKFNTCFGAVISIVYDLCFMNIILWKVKSERKEHYIIISNAVKCGRNKIKGYLFCH